VTQERLQKILARAGLASRRAAEDWIREGRVTINGQVATIGSKADPEEDAILVDGKRLRPPEGQVSFLVYKPSGCLTSKSDPQGRRTVMDLIPTKYRKRVVPAGRLDYESEGLVVMTTDGDLVLKITHPRYGCVKTYEVKVKGTPTEATMRRFRDGIVIDGKRTAPAKATLHHRPRPGKGEKNSWWTVELVEGRKRQIREMFFRLGHPVQRLKRVSIGGVSDSALRAGGYRHLSIQEIGALKGEAKLKNVRPKSRKAVPRSKRKSGR
jgi:23S rRNA pseudouridine2605 synthase